MRLSIPIFRLKRRAKLLARERGIALHEALDRVAGEYGFRSWSHLAASASEDRHATKILSQLGRGDLVLLGARPGHGKTLLGLELVVEATKKGRQGYFFTLDYHEGDVLSRLRSLGVAPQSMESSFVLDTADDICADYIIERVRGAQGDTVVVIDYLQLLDQKRSNPELADQIHALRAFANASGSIIVVISQIDRSFELLAKPLPELSDVRLPNSANLTLFTKTCFMHEGEVRLEAMA